MLLARRTNSLGILSRKPRCRGNATFAASQQRLILLYKKIITLRPQPDLNRCFMVENHTS